MYEKILLIDDDEDMRRLMRAILEKSNYQVHELSSGIDCIEIMHHLSPELVLLDIMMPDVGGFEICQSIKNDEKLRDIPVIFLSSLTAAKDKIKGLEIGGADFFNKDGDKGELLARVQNQLKISSLSKEIKEKNRKLMDKQRLLDEDLKSAAAIQRSLLPLKEKYAPYVDFAWKSRPCETVGGDVFNVIPLRDGSLVFYILDVSGHGVPSAMVTVSVSQTLHQILHESERTLFPGNVLKILNKEFPLERFDKFFTIFYMIINQSGNVYYSNAGHPLPILLHPHKQCEILERRGGIIGWGDIVPFEEGWVTLHPDDKLILYTDGVTEYQNAHGEFYGEEALISFLEQIKHKPIEEILDALLEELDRFGEGAASRDDLSLLAIEFKGNVWTSKSHSGKKEISQL